MQTAFIVTAFLTIFSLAGYCFGQDIVEDENWLKGLGTEADSLPFLVYLSKFSKEDLTRGKQRLGAVQKSSPNGEWEGRYFGNTPIGDSKLLWNAEGGFFNLYFYHDLRRFDFGVVKDSDSFVEFISEKITNSGKRISVEKLIKVKVGEIRFLVPEIRLQHFCNEIAGLSTRFGDFHYHWTKEEDMQKKVWGLPILPSKYKHFLRYPVEATIVSVGGKKVIPNKQSTKEYNFDDIHYLVTLNAGKNKNVKTKMNFFVEDLGEWIEIARVFQTKSIGFIRRDFDENNKEQCRDGEGGSGQIIPCREIKVGMKSKTKLSEMYF